MKNDILPLILWSPYWVIQDYLKIFGFETYQNKPEEKGIFRDSSVVLAEKKKSCTAILFYDFLSTSQSFLPLIAKLPVEWNISIPLLDFKLDTIEKQVENCLKQLKEDYEGDIVLIGHGYGGAVAEHISRQATWNKKVKKVFTIGGSGNQDHPFVGFWQIVYKLANNLTGGEHWKIGIQYPSYNLKRIADPKKKTNIFGDRDMIHPSIIGEKILGAGHYSILRNPKLLEYIKL